MTRLESSELETAVPLNTFIVRPFGIKPVGAPGKKLVDTEPAIEKGLLIPPSDNWR